MKIILDLDTGIDDALALAYALAHPDLDLIGITGTYGNVPVELGVRNARALLELLGADNVPVYTGPTREGFTVAPISAFIHGRNGLGEILLPPPRRTAQGDAVDFLIQSVQEHGEELVIVPTGPSTSIAAAMQKDPDFARNARIVMMGGALTVPGNVTPYAEANVFQDPQATDYLFRHAQDLTMVGLDVTLRTLLTTEHTAQWRTTHVGRVYADIVDYYIGAYATTSPHLGGCGLHDPLAVAVAADPSFVECIDLNLRCEENGRTIGDSERLSAPATTRVAVGVDAPRFVDDLMSKLTSLYTSTLAC
ncbi:nucleoside hydrolase [Corynebacterium minutissimum]|uniref:Inosine-uridine preferring nucleoside hydrolase n=1 Tax=Corynebacterium minutissimum TaxID=38301 RepID=A0A376D086_9CORY|nr:nucleoside hydrolase [Corynebacterium minutissimum]QRP61250.1 nucleoside hydrolase [Corynebacterium minutissimum]STC79043.1 inosine-uridine preferring nucleoside hydrolase [Corynebacterium minutissimum]